MTKQITVMSSDWCETITVDNDIFDDIYIEACTRAVEKLYINKSLTLNAVIKCHLTSSKNKKLYVFNSYKILINAGLHKPAELVRKNLYELTKKDWAQTHIKML
jgi:hypothetical protein